MCAPARVDPDPRDTVALRRQHVPLQVVADHPGRGRIATERRECGGVAARVRLAEAALALDADVVEERRQLEPLELRLLRLRGPVGDEAERDAGAAQALERLDRARQQ